MKKLCPYPDCLSDQTIRFGFFYRKEDSKKIQCFKCKKCIRKFSSASFSWNYYQKKRRVNASFVRLMGSGISLRRSAILLKINPKTAARKLKVLGAKCREQNQKHLLRDPEKVHNIQLDDLITKENSKLKPLSVTIAVNKDNRKILAVCVSKIPAFGHLAHKAIEKYGLRLDHHNEGLESVMKEIKPYLGREPLFESDEHQRYPYWIKKYFPHSEHKTFKSERSCVVGQGELKKVNFDPLFIINHTCAMLRANINRLIRKTWCTTKSIDRLKDHLDIFKRKIFKHFKIMFVLSDPFARDGNAQWYCFFIF